MPFIDLRTTVPAAPAQREALKTAFGQAITALHKTETYLMVSIQDSCELWLGGRKLEKGAYVAVSLYGSAGAGDYNRMTGLVCAILSEHLGIPADAVYVTYHPVRPTTPSATGDGTGGIFEERQIKTFIQPQTKPKAPAPQALFLLRLGR